MQVQPLDIVRQIDGADEQRRIHFSLNDFAEEEVGTNLDALLYFWQTVRRPGELVPRISAFQPEKVFDKSFITRYHGVDVTPAEAENFIILRHPGGPMSAIHGGMTQKRISEFPSRIHARSCAVEYNLCRSIGFPLYHEIDQIVSGFSRRYRRLMLPLADDDGNIVQLGYGVRQLEPTSRLF